MFSTGGRPGESVIPHPDLAGSPLVFHAYFGEGRGRGSALQISSVVWDTGWPRVAALP